MRVLFLILGVLGLFPLAQAQTIPAGKNAHVALIAEYTAAPNGTRVYLALDMTLRDGWHVYWRNPGDAGLPPEIAWTQTPEDTQIGPFSWPLPHELPIIEGELMDYGYDKAVTFPFAVVLPTQSDSKTWVFEGEADYLICKEICIPEIQPISLTLYKADFPTPNATSGTAIQVALDASPSNFSGMANLTQTDASLVLQLKDTNPASLFTNAKHLRFFPYNNEILHAANQPVQTGPLGAQITLAKYKQGSTNDTLDGVMVVTKADDTRQGYKISATAGASLDGVAGAHLNAAPQTATLPFSRLALMLGFAFLGGLILNVMPCVLPVLAFKAFGMLSVAGSGDAGKLRAHGLLYTAGVLVCFLALGVLTLSIRSAYGVASWGQWMQSPVIVALLIFAIVFAGLWMFGAFNFGGSLQNVGQNLSQGGGAKSAFFGGVLAASAGAPCVGPFLGVAIGALFTQPAWVLILGFAVIGLGLASPFLLLSFVPAWTKYLPKPGAWMEFTKQGLSFPMFLTAAWLCVTLGYLASPEAVAWVLAGIIGLASAAWVLGITGGSMRGKMLAAVLGLVSVLGPLTIMQTNAAPTNTAAVDSTDLAKTVWSAEAVQAALADGQGVFVDFTAKWCATCQVNKRTTMGTAAFKTLLEGSNTRFMEADFTRPDAVIAAELQKHNRAGVPMNLYYAPGSSAPIVLPEVLSVDLVRSVIENAK